ncbi:glycosyltransferase family 4 protein [Patescibacteria group bacterium]|nr:glycosyltransferase family 4 protein [Patescibacteria group bacterium]
MKIALLSPPWLRVPPKKYGGTEMVIFNLGEELVRRGHKVTLFASGDSKTSAKLIAYFKRGLGNNLSIKAYALPTLYHYLECYRRAGQFDIIHNHDEHYSYFFNDLVDTPVLNTLHGSYARNSATKDRIELIESFYYQNFSSISFAQQSHLGNLNFVGNVYNGINVNHFKFSSRGEDYLFWIGRICRKKGTFEAIRAAKRAKIPIVIAGNVDESEEWYFDQKVRPLIDGKNVIFTGELDYNEKVSFYRNAIATLSPIQWEEPFGLVMAESQACGTPVIVFNRGSAKEVVKDKLTGFLVPRQKGVNGIVEAIKKIDKIKRSDCRDWIKNRFSVEHMTDGYEAIYEKIAGLGQKPFIPGYSYSH